MTGRFPRGFPMMDPGSFDHLAVIMEYDIGNYPR